MRLPGLAVGFAPWLLFFVMPERVNDGALTFTALVSTGAALIAVRFMRRRSGVKLLDGAAVVTFAIVAALSAVEPAADWLREYSSGAVLFVLAAVMFGSLLRVPFTEQYAREALPAEYWRSPHLHGLNVSLSAARGQPARSRLLPV